MLFKFITSPDFNFLTEFAEQFQARILDDKMFIPESMGSGYIRRIDLSPDYKLLIHHYILKEDLLIRRIAPDNRHDLINIIFICNEETANIPVNEVNVNRNSDYAIQIASSDLELEVCFPAGMEIFYTVLGVRAKTLQELLNLKTTNQIVKKIIENNTGFIFHEEMDLDIFKTLRILTDETKEDGLSHFFYLIKVQELLYLLFKKLMQRTDNHQIHLNITDIEKLYEIRAAVLSDLSKPPTLKLLAQSAGLSETKMKDLFKQVFGDSIYNYYQRARMKQAAYLLKEKRYSVSETGYELGFLNLSHFSRIFKRYYGFLPKRYSSI